MRSVNILLSEIRACAAARQKVRRREKKKIGDVENNISGNSAELRQICCDFGDCSAGCGIFRRADGGDACNGAKRRAVFEQS